MGSEMCIRDSAHGVPVFSDECYVEFTWQGAASTILHSGFDGVVACLLYTSDAADDLLCVDLGGRRIIKKKNKTTQDSTNLSNSTT